MLIKSLCEFEEVKFFEWYDDKIVLLFVIYYLINLGKELIYIMEGLFDWG